MIDLRKPLEGVPGLFLLAALVFFGATIGVSLALMFSWVHMQNEVASFLGGIVGAALGSAFAVLGAVYVQRMAQKVALTAHLNQLWEVVVSVHTSLTMLRPRLEAPWPRPEDDEEPLIGIRPLLRKAEETAKSIGDFYELPPDIRGRLMLVRHFVPTYIDLIWRAVDEKRERTEEQKRERAIAWTDRALESLNSFMLELRKWQGQA